MNEIEVGRARAETPGAEQVLHFNNAGAALIPAPVDAAVRRHLDLELARGGYEAADAAHEASEAVYASIARLVGASPSEIALVDSATRAWDLAFHSLSLGEGDRILTSRAEYASNYIAYLQLARRRGVEVEAVPDDDDGSLSVPELERRLDGRVKLVAVTHVPTNGGLVNPVAAIGKLTRAAGVPFLVDACQSVGQLPVDVEEIGADFLSATGRKYLRGPRGTGFLYVRRALLERLEPPFLDLHSATWTATDRYEQRADARRFESWESNVAALLGLGAAAEYALAWGLERTYPRIVRLAERLRAGLGALEGVRVLDRGRERCGIVSFDVRDANPCGRGDSKRQGALEHLTEVKRALRGKGINVSVSDAASTLIDMQGRGLEAVVRASVHYYNTEDEVDRFVAAVDGLVP